MTRNEWRRNGSRRTKQHSWVVPPKTRRRALRRANKKALRHERD